MHVVFVSFVFVWCLFFPSIPLRLSAVNSSSPERTLFICLGHYITARLSTRTQTDRQTDRQAGRQAGRQTHTHHTTLKLQQFSVRIILGALQAVLHSTLSFSFSRAVYIYFVHWVLWAIVPSPRAAPLCSAPQWSCACCEWELHRRAAWNNSL